VKWRAGLEPGWSLQGRKRGGGDWELEKPAMTREMARRGLPLEDHYKPKRPRAVTTGGRAGGALSEIKRKGSGRSTRKKPGRSTLKREAPRRGGGVILLVTISDEGVRCRASKEEADGPHSDLGRKHAQGPFKEHFHDGSRVRAGTDFWCCRKQGIERSQTQRRQQKRGRHSAPPQTAEHLQYT